MSYNTYSRFFTNFRHTFTSCVCEYGGRGIFSKLPTSIRVGYIFYADGVFPAIFIFSIITRQFTFLYLFSVTLTYIPIQVKKVNFMQFQIVVYITSSGNHFVIYCREEWLLKVLIKSWFVATFRQSYSITQIKYFSSSFILKVSSSWSNKINK